MVPPCSDRISRVPPYSRIIVRIAHTGLSPTTARLSRRFCLALNYHWPGPRSLATTSGVSVDVLSCRYLDVSVPCVRHLTLCIQIKLPDFDTWKPFGFSLTGRNGCGCNLTLRGAGHEARRPSGLKPPIVKVGTAPTKAKPSQGRPAVAQCCAPRPEDSGKAALIREDRTKMISQVSQVGFPIRKSSDQRVFAPPRRLSQRITSFIACACQGIHQLPLRHLIVHIANIHLRASGSERRSKTFQNRHAMETGL